LKIKVGSKEIKKYGEPRSPYQRLPESDSLPPEIKAELSLLYGLYNPVQLMRHFGGSKIRRFTTFPVLSRRLSAILAV
jgi:hypothetical protein